MSQFVHSEAEVAANAASADEHDGAGSADEHGDVPGRNDEASMDEDAEYLSPDCLRQLLSDHPELLKEFRTAVEQRRKKQRHVEDLDDESVDSYAEEQVAGTRGARSNQVRLLSRHPPHLMRAWFACGRMCPSAF